MLFSLKKRNMIKKINSVISEFLAPGIVVLLVLTGCNYSREVAPQTKEMMRFKTVMQEAEPAFTAPEATALAEELIPLVEAAAGRKFKQIPKIRLIDRDTLAKVLLQDMLPQFTNLMPEADPGLIMDMAGSQIRWVTPFLIGKYGFMDRILFLIPGNVYPVMSLKKINKRYTQSIIKMLIAHELTHALQDQQIGLKQKFDNIQSPEASVALSAVIEGQAVLIQEMVGKKLGIDERLHTNFRLTAAGRVVFEDPMLEIQHEMAEANFVRIYREGRNFVQYHYRKGGNRKVWEILVEPPATSAMILKPETYAPTVKETVNYAELLTGLERYFGARTWKTQNYAQPIINLEAYCTGLSPYEKYELISKIAHVQILKFNIGNENVAGSVSVVALKDPKYGPRFIELSEKIAANAFRKLRTSKMYQMEDLAFENISGTNAEVARKTSYTLKKINGAGLQTVVVRIFLGNFVLEITDLNIGLENELLIDIAETVLRRYQEATAPPDHRQSEIDAGLSGPYHDRKVALNAFD